MTGGPIPDLPDRDGHEVIEVDTPAGPARAVAITLGPAQLEHVAWLHQRYADDDGRGYNRRALAANPTTARLARLR